jgi:hypothetical protein
MLKIKILLVLTLTILFEVVHSQKFELGVLGAGNVNFLTLKSTHTLQNEIKTKPVVGYNVGFFSKLQLAKKLDLNTTLEYQRIQNKEKPDFYFYDDYGATLLFNEKSLISHSIIVSAISSVKLGKGFYSGLGFSGNILVKSFMKIHHTAQPQEIEFPVRYEINYYRKMTYSIPIIVGYENDRYNIFIRFSKGLNSRIKDKEAMIKEIDNVLCAGLVYKFWRN